jgi:hypothetical protein
VQDLSELPIGEENLSALLLEPGEANADNGVLLVAPHLYCVIFGGHEQQLFPTMRAASKRFLHLCAKASMPHLIPHFKKDVYRYLLS